MKLTNVFLILMPFVGSRFSFLTLYLLFFLLTLTLVFLFYSILLYLQEMALAIAECIRRSCRFVILRHQFLVFPLELVESVNQALSQAD